MEQLKHSNNESISCKQNLLIIAFILYVYNKLLPEIKYFWNYQRSKVQKPVMSFRLYYLYESVGMSQLKRTTTLKTDRKMYRVRLAFKETVKWRFTAFDFAWNEAISILALYF